MNNIINIKESANRLDIIDTYEPIVCGNSNYILKFQFSEQWQKCDRKACFFVIDGNKQIVDFEGDECKVPVLPNGTFVVVSLVSGEGENQLATTPVKIRLEPTIMGGDFSEFNQLTNYLTKVLSALNAIKNGEVVAKYAINAVNSENSKNSDLSNLANFANNVSNANLLINGNFIVNQRGKNEYLTDGYTVDRWRQIETNMVVNADKTITLSNFKNNGRLVQYIEDVDSLKGKTVTLSVKFKDIKYNTESDPRIIIDDGINSMTSETISNGFNGVCSITKTISKNATNINVRAIQNNINSTNSDLSAIIEWVKLEIGTKPTEFSPRLYNEELALCQRYYQKINVMNRGSSQYSEIAFGYLLSNSVALINISLSQGLRVIPTLEISSLNHFNIRSDASEYLVPTKVELYANNKSSVMLKFYQTYSNNYNVCALRPNDTAEGYLSLDAEIY